ncbi:DNA polymerase epsilon catalytic subunit A-like [Cucumis melo var. makuwa]|uniref:DNA polymerase epsilon catalytic subunit A-like n=1 Tax=Cucumis melo var. makuwa TaxID=1194695 RepID=A0A5D3C2T2_CUCMM|nr:DNA polymerase epsilon catalytic subunit A-like [Cucumis melo var. makuwa]TYK05650.1 DNA polymerase epsilon catalytic subunit A-like [Cucumis melo var. makuwa]
MLSRQSQPSKSGMAYKVDYVVNNKEAEVILQKSITEYRSIDRGPLVAIIESPNVQLLKSAVKVLDDFPCLNIPCDAHHNQYQVKVLNKVVSEPQTSWERHEPWLKRSGKID